jgi:hypothetical protein
MNIKLSRSLSCSNHLFNRSNALRLLQDQLGSKVPKVLAEEQALHSSKSISSSELFKQDRKRLESCCQSNKQSLALIALFT